MRRRPRGLVNENGPIKRGKFLHRVSLRTGNSRVSPEQRRETPVPTGTDPLRRRTPRSLLTGPHCEVVQGLRFVCSDMWKPYLNVLAASVGQALHVLDRFHIASHLNQALDQVRRDESGRLRSQHHTQAAHLKNMRWKLLRRHSRVRGRARTQLGRLLRTKLETARAGRSRTSLNTSGLTNRSVTPESFWTTELGAPCAVGLGPCRRPPGPCAPIGN
ncbi:MAG: transposase [Limisphaerales bacterium]